MFFQNEEIAQKAKNDKHKQSIGKRYVEVLDVGIQDIVQWDAEELWISANSILE